jgi:hypothetical protein
MGIAEDLALGLRYYQFGQFAQAERPSVYYLPASHLPGRVDP